MSIEQELASLKRHVDDLITGLYWNTEARLNQLEQDVRDIYNIQLDELRLHVLCMHVPALLRMQAA